MTKDKDTAKILVVDDDSGIRNLVQRFLNEIYQVEAAEDGHTAMIIFKEFQPDLVILDVNLPDTLGYRLCEEMKFNTEVFILMLTSRSDIADKKAGFLGGADDYLTKPFDLEELKMRVAAILKRSYRSPAPIQKIIKVANLSIEPEKREVKVNDEIIHLTALEFDLLYFLAANRDRVLSREDILRHVWSYSDQSYAGEPRVVDVHIGQIRKKLEIDPHQPSLIQTVRGVGYRLSASNPS